jgi:hypothetical protein
MKDLWNRFTAWLSGWPEGVSKKNIAKEEEIDKAVKESKARKEKKPKGLNSKKKKVKKQGNMK